MAENEGRASAVPVERSSIDADRWPGVARIPDGPLLGRRANLARGSFRRACVRHGVDLEGDGSASILVRDPDAMFRRLAEADWVGLGESFLAGEWESETLPSTLSALIDAGLDVGAEGRVGRGLRKLSGRRPEPRSAGPGGELPVSLIELYAGSSLAGGSGLFASGARTTSLEEVPNQAPGAGRGGVPARHRIDVTRIDDPEGVARADLPEAQARRVERMLDLARVRAGDRVLEWPSSGGELALRAADRGASADVLAISDDHAETVAARAAEAGLSGPVRVLRADRAIPSPRDFDGDYEAIFNVERLETFGPDGIRRWLRGAERVLADRGTIVVQMAVATDRFDDSAGDALDLVRSYVWPALHYPTIEEFRRIVDRDTGLRIVSESHFGGHWERTLDLWRGLFAARSRQAAGLGYDRVYRRLWDYHLGLQQALAASGRLDMVHVELMARPRSRR
ncbi:class I SAM-dependent methyltransferase [uncultured Corynebacterium sp.]|uniref:class I SAM-dependent methyltransferase n=1 Tax=uncultured Corynebacterium sp. TaxID=159447 RepID=UPI0025F6421A|nr:class I SAM-dependent methyltransferase [uncultured Corynebacterium sp.]